MQEQEYANENEWVDKNLEHTTIVSMKRFLVMVVHDASLSIRAYHVRRGSNRPRGNHRNQPLFVFQRIGRPQANAGGTETILRE